MSEDFYKQVLEKYEAELVESMKTLERDCKADPSDDISRDTLNVTTICYNMLNRIKKDIMDEKGIYYKEVNPLA